jgi:hypothetical protein
MPQNRRSFPSLFVDAAPGERTSLVLVPAAKLGLGSDQDFLAGAAYRLGLSIFVRLSGANLIRPLDSMLGWAGLGQEERRRIGEILQPGRRTGDLTKLAGLLEGALVAGPGGSMLLLAVPQGALLIGSARGALRGIAEEFGEPLGAADRLSPGSRPVRMINQRRLAFEDLAAVSERSLPRLIRQVGEDRLALALKDAPPAIADRLCASLSQRRRRLIGEQVAALAEADTLRTSAARDELLSMAQDLYDHLELTIE